MNGCLTYDAEIDNSLFNSMATDLEIVSVSNGKIAIQSYDSIEVFMTEDNVVQIHWYGFSYKDLPELQYFMENRLDLPEEVTLNSIEKVRFRLQHKVTFLSDVKLSVDTDDIQKFQFDSFNAYGILKDEELKEFRLSSVEAPLEDLENILQVYTSCADSLGERFTVLRFL